MNDGSSANVVINGLACPFTFNAYMLLETRAGKPNSLHIINLIIYCHGHDAMHDIN